MTVYKADRNKIKIVLTDSDVQMLFGSYNGLNSMDSNVRLTIALLLKENIKIRDSEYDGDWLIEIRAKENFGCIIMVSRAEKRRETAKKLAVLDFRDADSMLHGITALHQSRKFHGKSALYKIENTYRLILTAKNDKSLFFMNEFCSFRDNAVLAAAYAEEYGEPIVLNDAVRHIGNLFKAP